MASMTDLQRLIHQQQLDREQDDEEIEEDDDKVSVTDDNAILDD